MDMNSSIVNKLLINFSLLLGQITHPTPPADSLLSINIALSDIKENFNTNRPFRMIMAKNAGNNICLAGASFYDAYQGKRKDKTLSDRERFSIALIGGSQLLFSAASLLTSAVYPEENSWSGSYKKKTTSSQLQTMVALCLISCSDAIIFPVFKDRNDKIALAESLVSAAICAVPFFISFQHLALNINK